MALRDIGDIGTRRRPRAYIKWGHSQVLYLTYTTEIPLCHLKITFAIIILILNVGFSINTLCNVNSFIPVYRL